MRSNPGRGQARITKNGRGRAGDAAGGGRKIPVGDSGLQDGWHSAKDGPGLADVEGSEEQGRDGPGHPEGQVEVAQDSRELMGWQKRRREESTRQVQIFAGMGGCGSDQPAGRDQLARQTRTGRA